MAEMETSTPCLAHRESPDGGRAIVRGGGNPLRSRRAEIVYESISTWEKSVLPRRLDVNVQAEQAKDAEAPFVNVDGGSEATTACFSRLLLLSLAL